MSDERLGILAKSDGFCVGVRMLLTRRHHDSMLATHLSCSPPPWLARVHGRPFALVAVRFCSIFELSRRNSGGNLDHDLLELCDFLLSLLKLSTLPHLLVSLSDYILDVPLRSRALMILVSPSHVPIFFSISACSCAMRHFASGHSHACKPWPTHSSSVHAFCHWRKESLSARRWSSLGVISSARREVVSHTRFCFLPIVFWALFLPSSNMRVPAASSAMPRISWGHKLRAWEGNKGEFSFLEVVGRIW